jgi:ribosomal protein S14
MLREDPQYSRPHQAQGVHGERARAVWAQLLHVDMANRERAHRQALRYIIRNTTLPQRVRAQAQLQLSQMHCYTRFTQVKNRCIMGGKGRGVFSDFRLGRVCIAHVFGCEYNTDLAAVSIPNKRARGKSARSEEGKLVKRRQTCVFCVLSVYYCKKTHLIGRRLHMECNMIQHVPVIRSINVVTRCSSFSARSHRGYPKRKQTRRLNRYL